jgi:hypothetical protein
VNVFVLCTCRKAELIRASTLVFDTIRVGYPTAGVTVFLNAVEDERWAREIAAACREAGVERIVDLAERTIHHEWIERLVAEEDEPLVVLDTDVVFWGSCERWRFSSPLAGRLIPQYFDPWANCITRSRLHGSHLWIRPAEVRAAIDRYRAQFPSTPFNPGANLFYPLYLPASRNGRRVSYFHDTCCLLYHAIGGDAFTAAQLDAYDHLHCGTISDLVGPRLPSIDLPALHRGWLADPRTARGLWREQERYYRRHAVA